MTPERIEEQVTAVVIGINYGRSEKLTEDEEDIIRLALRQCAREAADEALEKAASECDMNPSAILLTAGELSALGVVRDAIRALKGKP